MTRRTIAHLAVTALLVAALPTAARLQQTSAPTNTPAYRLSEDQIRSIVGVRVGRKLTKAWPGNAKVAVSLAFEMDAEGSAAAPAEILPVQLSAKEFGVIQGLPRVLDVLDRHKVPATFYFSAMNATLHPETVALLAKRAGSEIALNGWMHENLADLNDDAAEKKLLDDSIATLTKVAGRRPVGWRAPSWTFSHFTLGRLQQAGFLYDSSLQGRDEPYEIIARGQDTGLIELPLEPILNDEPYFTTTRSFPAPESIFRVYQDEFDVAYREGTMLMLTLHPYVVGHRSRIGYLDKLLVYMKSKPGVWFATGEQIASHVKPARDK
jgi:peptidoglycan-N-acetylglucosamine deacetylase